ncbi:trypsin-like peptidase domain-containing protein [Algirhabdus cladophorae]|uniref:trypsin-like peptidase domain-containing protein n=1 Tax=Algirhabdus cladophorae TaxID=3377108 RepID=UPI003B84519E
MKHLLTSALLVLATFPHVSPAMAQTKVPDSQIEIQLGFAPLVKQAAPAVVNIYARRVVQTQTSPFAGDPFFDNLFRDMRQSRPKVQNSLGSGVILSEDGILVSNYHVVGMATDIRVVLNDRREYSAKVLLGDQDADIAILQIETDEALPYLPFRASQSVEVGELVLAIGNPFGVGQTVSSGIVSGLARSGTATGNARGYFIQTDAPINPGNSGGALIDVQGNLIGVNTSILTRSGGSNGIGFAIPADLVAQFVSQAKAGNTEFIRPWAGITGQSVDQALSEGLGLPRPEGVVISQINPDSPFAKAGLAVGDVILRVDGLPVNTPAEMLFRMSLRGQGDLVDFDVILNGQEKTVAVPMLAPPKIQQSTVLQMPVDGPLAGLSVALADAAVRTELRLPPSVQGVVVLNPGPTAGRIGLRPGDVLREINNTPIVALQDVADTLNSSGRRVKISAQRGNQRLTLRFGL